MYTIKDKKNGWQYSIFGVPDIIDLSLWGDKTPYDIAMANMDKKKLQERKILQELKV
jgi:hypothetical protein